MFQITHKLTSLFHVEFDSKEALFNYVGLYVRNTNFTLSPCKCLWEVQNFSRTTGLLLIFTTWKTSTNCTNCTFTTLTLNMKNNSQWLSKLWFVLGGGGWGGWGGISSKNKDKHLQANNSCALPISDSLPRRVRDINKIHTASDILCLLDRASLWQLKNKRPTWRHLLFYFTS